MITQPPMPKTMTIFCVRAKILIPNTTKRNPMTLKMLAMKKVTQLELTSQSAAPVHPRYWNVITRPGSTASGASTYSQMSQIAASPKLCAMPNTGWMTREL